MCETKRVATLEELTAIATSDHDCPAAHMPASVVDREVGLSSFEPSPYREHSMTAEIELGDHSRDAREPLRSPVGASKCMLPEFLAANDWKVRAEKAEDALANLRGIVSELVEGVARLLENLAEEFPGDGLAFSVMAAMVRAAGK